MVGSAKPKRKTPVRKPEAKKPPVRQKKLKAADNRLVDQMRTLAGKVLDMGVEAVGATSTLQTATRVANTLRSGKPMEAAADVLMTLMPSLAEPDGWVRTGSALQRLRKATGLTVAEVSAAINLKDPSLVEAWEKGRIAVPFEVLLRLAAVLGRNDPVAFVLKFTRSSNPDLWRSLEELGVGKLLIQSAREREFANILRGDDEARSLTDEEFAEVLSFTHAAFEMAMTFRGRNANSLPTATPPKSD